MIGVAELDNMLTYLLTCLHTYLLKVSELDEMRDSTEEELHQALREGRSTREAIGWSHAVLGTAKLRTAATGVVAFARPRQEGRDLARRADSIIEVREALTYSLAYLLPYLLTYVLPNLCTS